MLDELAPETGVSNGCQSRLLMKVQRAALGPIVWRCFAFENRDGYAGLVEQASQHATCVWCWQPFKL
jgi:hypothetical protein